MRKIKTGHWIMIFALVFGFLAIFAITEIYDDSPPEKPVFSSWYGNPQMAQASWSTLGKIAVYYSFPFLMVAVLISWVIHGVGFFVVRR